MKKTLMFYINAIHDGGAERVIIQLAKHFAQAGYESVLVTSFVDEHEYSVPSSVIRVSIEQEQIIQSKVKRNVSRIHALRMLCKKYRPLALISFMAEPNFRAVLATIGLPVKNIVSVRNDPNREYAGRLGKFIGKHVIVHADGCVFQTVDEKEWFPKRFQNKSAVINNDVDNVFFETNRVGGNTIVNLGRLDSQKNQALLIRAYSKIEKKYPQNDLEIYGIGEKKEELEKLIDALHLERRVHLCGLSNDVPNVLSHAGYFVLSSDFEGMPNALLEALAMGVPSISTDCPAGGPKCVIQNGENGLLVPVGDENALVRSLDWLLEDKERAEKLGISAKKSANEFRTDIVFEKWKQYIEGVCNS